MIDKSRTGRFFVDINSVEDGLLPKVFKTLDITIVRAEMLWHRRGIEYIGVSPNFDVATVELDYVIEITRDTEDETVFIPKIRKL